MAETLHALGQILLQALPTFFLVIFLYIYLNQMYFKPFGKVLAERRALTEGAREQARMSLDRAAERMGVYEASLRAERGELYKEQEEQRRKWRDEQAAEIREARRRMDQKIAEAKADLKAQAAQAKQSLTANSQALANEIVQAILDRRPA
jgi:F-type H+-transporting ATPase subunit b